jgi:hypothetical protein
VIEANNVSRGEKKVKSEVKDMIKCESWQPEKALTMICYGRVRAIYLSQPIISIGGRESEAIVTISEGAQRGLELF